MGFQFKNFPVFVLLLLATGIVLTCPVHTHAQKVNKRKRIIVVDSTLTGKDSTDYVDSVRKQDIRKAIIRSAVIPGWGQISNKQAWKVPIVYGGLSIPAYMFFTNVTRYKELRDTYRVLMDPNSTWEPEDFPDYLRPILNQPNSIRFYRDAYRRDVDYSVLYFVGAWGLNVVDAAVFAHLRDFDVSDDLSMRIQPKISPQFRTVGVSLVFNISDNKKTVSIK